MSLECYSQHSEKFINLTSNLKPSDSINVNLKFKNGNQQEIGKLYEYEIGEFVYSFYTGKRLEFYKNGSIAYEYEYDNFGILISLKWYDGNNNLWQESQTLKIESEALNIKDFIKNNSGLSITVKEKIFRYDKETCDYYIKKEGQRINGKKIGVWKTFDTDGSIKKEDLF